MIRLKTLVTLCLFFCVPPAVFAETTPPATLFEDAAALLEQGQALEATAIYRRILDGSSNREQRARALLFLSTLYSRNLNLPDTAVACLEQIEATYPNTSVIIDARFALGTVTYRSGRFRQAVTHFKQFIERYPDHMRSSSARAWLREAETLAGTERPNLVQNKAMDQLPDTVRVLIRNKEEKVILGKAGEPMAVLQDGLPLFEGDGPVTLTRTGQDLAINGVKAGSQTLSVQTPGRLPRVDGHAYRGEVTLWPEEKGISVVNTLAIEPYLYGVLPKEMSPLWPEEALKAQAIASRTYTYHTLLNRKGHPRFDLEATTAFQVYGGADAETPETTRPVDLTRGRYLAFQGLPIIACFHANSGGMTESADAVWGAALPYLQGVKDSFSRLAPEACWKKELKKDTMVRRLWAKGYRPGGIISLTTADPSPSGRTGQVIISTSRGRLELTGNEFRQAMGPTVIKSAWFTATRQKKGYLFEGCGYGHGVGMSQWGARKMATSGFTCDTILHHYYKNVSLVSIDKEGRR
ncbi:SpoIID/LytB domain-containing protein [Desulfoluna sp.]|uniref:SpoIID/LytB domain-containing protein n=1 Tax=Desulfoluna sp. TaxID=2045199 RepID=UPI002630C2BF|nr:SpoIID/LytB domain-containing protein [Desulfoluna sp.]